MKIGIFDHLSLRLGGGQHVVARMAELLSQQYEVDVIHTGKGYTLSTLATAFDVDLSRARERIEEGSLESFSIPGRQSFPRYLRYGLPSERTLTEPYDLFIYVGQGAPPFSYARQGLIYCHFPFEGHPNVFFPTDERWARRRSLDRWLRLILYERLWDLRMRGYGTVLANSHFTAGWIERLWGRLAMVVYPPVDVSVLPLVKQNIIVSVGRFVATDRKNLSHQLKALPEFLSRVRSQWRLYMIGFCADLPEDRAYLEKLRTLAQDLPITFVVDAERNTVLTHLAEAKLFWHTTGLSDNGYTAPRYMEHFGIATVEAMMAGCVPVVPDCGGQAEIVEHGVSGFLCRDLEELVASSARLANDDHLQAEMRCKAIERSMAFRPQIFEERFAQVVRDILERPRQRNGNASSIFRPRTSSISMAKR